MWFFISDFIYPVWLQSLLYHKNNKTYDITLYKHFNRFLW